MPQGVRVQISPIAPFIGYFMKTYITFFYIFISFIFLIFFLSCGGDRAGDLIKAPNSCSIESENEFVYEYMKSTYLWSDKIKHIDYMDAKYRSIEILLEDLKYKELDKWSYITSTKSYDQYFEDGQYVGLGFSQAIDADKNESIIRFVYPNSPADKANLKRGDKILKINRLSIKDIQTYNLWTTIYGESEVNVSVNLYVLDKFGNHKDINISKDIVSIKTVLYKDVLKIDNKNIGYLLFQSFIEPSIQELDEAFEYFVNNSVDELILDLRYNGGGRVDVANHLASLIGGNLVAFKIFAKMRHNKNSPYSDYEIPYQIFQKNSLSLNRVFVITTQNTCSASELVINSLRATPNGIEVITVGESSCGKPVGMYGTNFCDKHISPIQFSIQNADDKGEYFDGIAPTCSEIDKIDRDFGDINESMLKTALYYIKNDQCLIETNSRGIKKKYKQIPLEGFQKEINAI